MDEEKRRAGQATFWKGYNTGAKKERERQAGERRRRFDAGFEAGQKKERKRLATERRRKKWFWQAMVIMMAFSVVVVKAIDILIMQLVR